MCLAIPGKISSIESDDPIMRTGKVDFGGVIREVNLAYVPEANLGDYVIVHAGFALNVVDEAEAARILETIDEIESLGNEDTPS
jgi:hydrogenase expression/formation protein HypC